MFTYAKCRGSPWLLHIPAEDDKGEGKLRWEIGKERSLTGHLFFDQRDDQRCSISAGKLPAL